MKITSFASTKVGRSVIGTTLVASVALFGVVGYASAESASVKSAAYNYCRAQGNSAKTCCHALGGQYEEEYDEAGNLIAVSCTLHSDPNQIQQGSVLPSLPVSAGVNQGPTTSTPTSTAVSPLKTVSITAR